MNGTIFIQNVCKVFDEAYKGLPDNIPLSQMIININTSVRDSGIQLADPINHLMADAYFTPKNVSFTWNMDIFFPPFYSKAIMHPRENLFIYSGCCTVFWKIFFIP
jgi:hypothetical protein